MGRRKSGRDVSGVILLDKPFELTSNAVLQKVRRFFDARKAGHTGALDPLATGLLPLCFGEATKVSHFALEADKTYEVTAKLGERTSTSDAEGEVVERRAVAVTEAQIREVLQQFEGEQAQSPSMFSALKHEGRPLYYYAREGIEVPRKTRTITIFKIRLLELTDTELSLEVTCSKGTYIRTLVDDIGQALGCGAHVVALRRTWIAGVEGPMLTLDELADLAAKTDPEAADFAVLDQQLLANDAVINHLPVVAVVDGDAAKFIAGNPAQPSADLAQIDLGQSEYFRVIRASDGVFIGIGRLKQQKVVPKRVLNGII